MLRDYQTMENALGSRLPASRSRIDQWMPVWLERWCYRYGFGRGFMDTALDQWIVAPFVSIFQRFDSWERATTDWISHEESRESDRAELHPESTGRKT